MITKKYEAMMVFSVASGDEATNALIEKFKALVSENGTIESVDDWGKRRLAYPINDEVEGYYIVVNFESNAGFPAELDRVAKITDGVLRVMVTVK